MIILYNSNNFLPFAFMDESFCTNTKSENTKNTKQKDIGAGVQANWEGI